MCITSDTKIHLISLGCPKNLVDSEKILGALGASGLSVSASPYDSDIIIINTCGFIKPALEETEAEILNAIKIARAGNKKIYGFGCAVNRYYSEFRNKFPEVNGWFKLEERNALLQIINAPAISFDSRLLSTRGYAYLKIADGCSNHCSYCTIPSIKGTYHSFDMAYLIKEALELSKLGVKEIILIAQDTTQYGIDRYNKPMLVPLIRSLSEIPEIEWIRIMYTHPKSINDDLIKEIESNKKVCKYIDIPIQHINTRILKLMNRGVDKKRIDRLFRQLKRIKGISIRTTVIVGFPKETESNFNKLVNFIKDIEVDWLGVFPYFQESGTKSALLKPLPEHTVNQRYNSMLELQQDLLQKKNHAKVGKVYRTLIHSKNGNYIGHTEFAAPEIDNHIITNAKNLKVGNFYKMKIIKPEGHDLYAKNAE
jgi:ribosomal protein S12 methylthiotransferase